MGKNLFVGNLSFSTTNESLTEAFAAYGTVTSARVVTDRDTGRSRGFGFVEMSSDEEAQAAIASLNDSDFMGRKIVVNEAKPQENRGGSRGGSGGGGRGGYGGGNRGGGGGGFGGGRDGGGRGGFGGGGRDGGGGRGGFGGGGRDGGGRGGRY